MVALVSLLTIPIVYVSAQVTPHLLDFQISACETVTVIEWLLEDPILLHHLRRLAHDGLRCVLRWGLCSLHGCRLGTIKTGR